MQKKTELNLWYVALAVLGVLAVQALLQSWQQTAQIPYSRFIELVEEGGVDGVVVGSETVTGRLSTRSTAAPGS